MPAQRCGCHASHAQRYQVLIAELPFTLQHQAVRMSPAMSAPPAFMGKSVASRPSQGGLGLGRGQCAAGRCKAQSRACGRAFPGPAAGWNGCGGMLCFLTDAALYKNGERSPGNRSAVHVPTQRAAPAIAACCIGYRTVVPSGSEKQSLREVKSVPSGSEKCKVQSEKWSLREVKSAKCKVKSGPFGK